MEIQRTNNLQFGARFISPAKIKYKAPNGKWEKMDVSFIKFDTYKKSDVSLVENISQLWNNKNLSGAIAEEANILGPKSQIYALTSQLKDFEQINPRQVLGLMTTGKIKKGEDVEIFKIGTNPLFAYEQNHRDRTFKHIAKSMIESFKNLVGLKSKGSETFVQYADSPQEIKFLSRVGLEPRDKEIVRFINK